MPKELKEITTKTGVVIKESYCRKCMKMRPASEFYDCVDLFFIFECTGIVNVFGVSVCVRVLCVVRHGYLLISFLVSFVKYRLGSCPILEQDGG